jgi:uncharacterized damage-inducible protein DinB
MKIEELQYPIGKFSPQHQYTPDEINSHIDRIEAVPSKIEAAFASLHAEDLDTPYRPGGWTVRQVLHHIPDSHLNAYIRIKWTLTEETPMIKAYDEKRWAETPETKLDPHPSIALLKGLHKKWVTLLRQLTPSDLQKAYVHPETGKPVRLDRMLHLYAWHGEHHLGHILLVAQKKK